MIGKMKEVGYLYSEICSLGDHASEEHKKVIKYALEMNNLKKLILVGDRFKNEIKDLNDKEREKVIQIENRVDDFPYLELTR